MPLLALRLTYRKPRQGEDDSLRRRLIHVLTRSYREDAARYMESIDLMRKFLLAGAIFIVVPDSRGQLWFGRLMSLAFLLIDRRLEPFQLSTCGAVQFAAHLQLLFMYMTADLFYVEDADMTRGTAASEYAGDYALSMGLIAANSVAFLLIFASTYRGLRRITTELSGERLRWADDGTALQLAPPLSPDGYHIFLSHVWAHGQDLAGSLKSNLRALLSGLGAFLDVDDLKDINQLEAHVRASDVTLIVLTDKYVSSANCRRELVTAMEQNRLTGTPLVVLAETDEAKGATKGVPVSLFCSIAVTSSRRQLAELTYLSVSTIRVTSLARTCASS